MHATIKSLLPQIKYLSKSSYKFMTYYQDRDRENHGSEYKIQEYAITLQGLSGAKNNSLKKTSYSQKKKNSKNSIFSLRSF